MKKYPLIILNRKTGMFDLLTNINCQNNRNRRYRTDDKTSGTFIDVMNFYNANICYRGNGFNQISFVVGTFVGTNSVEV